MSKIRTMTAKETTRYLCFAERYGRYCARTHQKGFEECLTFDALAGYDQVQEVFDAYFLLTKGAFQAAWRKGFRSSEGNTELSLF